MVRKRGLTVGKYAPLHRGHQLVIETALAEMDEVIVLIYDSPQVTEVPVHVRSQWIRSLYPGVELIEGWNGPTVVGYTPEIRRTNEDYIIKVLNGRTVTHFYSSEPYGDHMSRALKCIDRRVDQARSTFPISGTLVRQDPFGCRQYLHPTVYRDLITNVVLLGAESTGKSTLAERLASEFHTQWMPEYGREYWAEHQVDGRLTPDQLVAIAEGHLEREEALLCRANRYLFTDTNALTTATFARSYRGAIPSRLAELANATALRYDLVLVCDTDVPYDDTWDRTGEANRAVFQCQVLDDLRERKIPYFIVHGSLDERVAQVKRLLGAYHKYMNVLDLVGRARL